MILDSAYRVYDLLPFADTLGIRETERTPMAFSCDIPAVPSLQQDDAMLRITRWDFEPGAVTGWHEHGWPYFVIMLEAGTLRLHDGAEITDVPLTKGQSYMRPAGVKHDVMNASPHAISFVEIEMKQPGELRGTAA